MNRKTYTSRRIVSALALIGSVAAIAVPTASAGNQNDPGIVPSKLGSQDPRDTAGLALYSPSIVASRLGSQDPRDTAVAELNQPSLVARQLGSQDSRDTVAESTFDVAAQEHGAAGFGNVQVGSDELNQSSLVAMKLGSQDSRDTAAESVPQSSVVASELGSPDTKDAGLQSDGDYMFRDYFRGTHYVAQNGSSNPMLTDFSGMHWAAPLKAAPVSATKIAATPFEREMAVNNLLHHTIQPAPVDSTQVSNDGIDWGKVGIGIAVAVCGLLLLGALGIGTRQVRHGGHRLGRA